MASLTIRKLDDAVKTYLRLRSAGNGRSVEEEVRVILGDKKFVNTEAPRAIADLFCFKCKTPIRDLCSFKCHNWAYAKPQLLDVLEQMKSKAR